MTDETSEKPLVESVPSHQGEISAIGSANAPFIYLDRASTSGFRDGIVNVTLEAVRHHELSTGVYFDRVIVAHLRMSVAAAQSLHAALGHSIAAAAKPASDTAH